MGSTINEPTIEADIDLNRLRLIINDLTERAAMLRADDPAHPSKFGGGLCLWDAALDAPRVQLSVGNDAPMIRDGATRAFEKAKLFSRGAGVFTRDNLDILCPGVVPCRQWIVSLYCFGDDSDRIVALLITRELFGICDPDIENTIARLEGASVTLFYSLGTIETGEDD